jgi:hypothetical protein
MKDIDDEKYRFKIFRTSTKRYSFSTLKINDILTVFEKTAHDIIDGGDTEMQPYLLPFKITSHLVMMAFAIEQVSVA